MTRRATARAVALAAEAGVRVAVYIRRSTDEEHQPFSLEAQESKLRAYITPQPGWGLVATFGDDASGATLERPGLRKALAAARAGRFDVLLVYRVDRFTRRIRDLVALLDDLDTAGVAFRSATEPFDTSTAAGRMLVQMLGVFAGFEREMIIDRVVSGMERKAAKGRWTLGKAPFGYTIDPPSTSWSPTRTRPPTVKEIFHLYTSRRLAPEPSPPGSTSADWASGAAGHGATRSSRMCWATGSTWARSHSGASCAPTPMTRWSTRPPSPWPNGSSPTGARTPPQGRRLVRLPPHRQAHLPVLWSPVPGHQRRRPQPDLPLLHLLYPQPLRRRPLRRAPHRRRRPRRPGRRRAEGLLHHQARPGGRGHHLSTGQAPPGPSGAPA
jgi:DNA invertase Pin-like site-specific DNA recombinase